jgi:oligoendopeptidase F
MNEAAAILQKPTRHFLPEDFQVTGWDTLKPYFETLLRTDIEDEENLMVWLRNISELESVISEDVSWRQIHMTCDTTNKAYQEAFNFFCMEIQPRLQPLAHELNKKLIASPAASRLDPGKYFPYLRSVRNSVELFREENVPLAAELSVMQQQYGVICGSMTITVQGKEYTLQQAAKFMESPDRSLREEVFRKVAARRLQDREALNSLFDGLLVKRIQVARNAGFDNYRDYKFRELGRFDYSVDDCFRFHEGVRDHLVPLCSKILVRQKERIAVETLRPWDTEAEPAGTKPLQPFRDGNELTEKAIACFSALNPYFGDCLRVMRQMGRLDLDSRKGKAPGGYNCPLAETGVPFIFMNAAGQMKDVTTMVHEGGHALHAFLSHGLELEAFKEYPMEIAEVASMGMELLSMDHWDLFFSNPQDLKRAKLQQLERVITIFPWIATVDKFQHWIYTNEGHSDAERTKGWLQILDDFSAGMVDWTGLETFRSSSWQRQLHLYEVPFYYIEYGIAQLGAISLWKLYRENKDKALEGYMQALSLGNTRPLKSLYEAASLSFDLSPEHIRELGAFVQQEIEALWA